MNVLDTLFGPIGKQYCSLFYYLSISSFILYVFTLVGVISYGIKNKKGISYYATSIFMGLVYLLAYFQNRLLFSMCTR